jgi:hypothetical protein
VAWPRWRRTGRQRNVGAGSIVEHTILYRFHIAPLPGSKPKIVQQDYFSEIPQP